MLRKTIRRLPILTVLALIALPVKGWAYDWNQYAGPGYASHNQRPYYQRYNNGPQQPYYGNNGFQQPYYGYNSGYNSLTYARASAQAQYDAAVARGDRKGVKHLGNAIRKLDKQIAATNGSAAANGYYPYDPYASTNSPSYSNYNNMYANGSPVGVSGAASIMLPLIQQFMSR